MLKTSTYARGDILRRLDVITLHVDDADSNVLSLGDFANQLQFGKFAAGHFQMDLIHIHFQECRKHRGVTPRANRPAFVIPEAEVSREAAFADGWLDGAIESIDEPLHILTMGVATH